MTTHGEATTSSDPLYDRIWRLRAEREAVSHPVRWAEITREIEEETGRIGRVLWERRREAELTGCTREDDLISST